MQRLQKKILSYRIILFDALSIALSLPISIQLMSGNPFVFNNKYNNLKVTVIFIVISLILFYYFRVHAGVWRHTSIKELVCITKAISLSMLVFYPLVFALKLNSYPYTLAFVHWLLLMFFIGGARIVYRLYVDKTFYNKDDQSSDNIKALLLYEGNEAEIFLRYQNNSQNSPHQIIGLISDSDRHLGQFIQGVKVLGKLNNLEKIIEKLPVKPTLLILPSREVKGWTVREIVTLAEKFLLSVSRLPKIEELESVLPNSKPIVIRPLLIEDLLRRPQKNLDKKLMTNLIVGKTVLVTGSGGSIGSELVRQIAAADPEKIILLDSSEHLLYKIDMEISQDFPKLVKKSVLADIRDRTYIFKIIESDKPDIVFHAAALKHVPLVEFNPEEGIFTNVIGTRNVADACLEHNVSIMVQISTDKVVNPTSLMGATKRIAEMYSQSLDYAHNSKGTNGDGTKFVTVRFGNVLGSNGSVVPLFQQQIEEGGPITITHPEMTRYFMSIKEAVELVMLAAASGNDPASTPGQIFVLEMGEPVKIVDLANQMIRLSNKNGIKIVYSGMRLGEKLHEELFSNEEKIVPSQHEGLRMAISNPVDLNFLKNKIDLLEKYVRNRDSDMACGLLRELVFNFDSSYQQFSDTKLCG